MITIELTGDEERRVDELIASGRFVSVNDFLSAALHALESLERGRNEERARIAAAVEAGIEDVRAGNVGPLDLEAMRAEAMQELEEARRKAG